jgi:hypothetical protein
MYRLHASGVTYRLPSGIDHLPCIQVSQRILQGWIAKSENLRRIGGQKLGQGGRNTQVAYSCRDETYDACQSKLSFTGVAVAQGLG